MNKLIGADALRGEASGIGFPEGSAVMFYPATRRVKPPTKQGSPCQGSAETFL